MLALLAYDLHLLNGKSAMKHFAILAIIACVWVCSLSGTARADQVIFNSFGPGDSYDSALLHVAGSLANSGYEAVAVAFTPTVTANVTSISFPAQGVAINVNMVLANDSGGNPGSALETFSSIALGGDTILTENSVLHPSLTAGTTYWLEMLPSDPSNTFGFGGWNGTSPNVAGLESQSNVPGFWQDVATSEIAAFDVMGTGATPEPASLSLFGIGALGLLGFCGLKRKRAAN